MRLARTTTYLHIRLCILGYGFAGIGIAVLFSVPKFQKNLKIRVKMGQSLNLVIIKKQ